MSAGLLGDWYATYLPWRPRQVTLLVNERTLLPLLMPLAPAATFPNRFPDEMSALLEAQHPPESGSSYLRWVWGDTPGEGGLLR